MATPAPHLSRADLPEIVQRYLDGETLTDLAAESHRHPRTLYRWLLAECGPQYQSMVTECLTNRIADADVALEMSTDMCSLARAREATKYARMDFERRCPKLYGPKQETTSDHTLTVIVRRLDDDPRPQPIDITSGRSPELGLRPTPTEQIEGT